MTKLDFFRHFWNRNVEMYDILTSWLFLTIRDRHFRNRHRHICRKRHVLTTLIFFVFVYCLFCYLVVSCKMMGEQICRSVILYNFIFTYLVSSFFRFFGVLFSLKFCNCFILLKNWDDQKCPLRVLLRFVVWGSKKLLLGILTKIKFLKILFFDGAE